MYKLDGSVILPLKLESQGTPILDNKLRRGFVETESKTGASMKAM